MPSNPSPNFLLLPTEKRSQIFWVCFLRTCEIVCTYTKTRRILWRRYRGGRGGSVCAWATVIEHQQAMNAITNGREYNRDSHTDCSVMKYCASTSSWRETLTCFLVGQPLTSAIYSAWCCWPSRASSSTTLWARLGFSRCWSTFYDQTELIDSNCSDRSSSSFLFSPHSFSTKKKAEKI